MVTHPAVLPDHGWGERLHVSGQLCRDTVEYPSGIDLHHIPRIEVEDPALGPLGGFEAVVLDEGLHGLRHPSDYHVCDVHVQDASVGRNAQGLHGLEILPEEIGSRLVPLSP